MKVWKKVGQEVVVKLDPRLVSKTRGRGAAVGGDGTPIDTDVEADSEGETEVGESELEGAADSADSVG